MSSPATTLPDNSATGSAASYPLRSQAYYALIVFTVANFISFLDRSMLAQAVQPIEHALHISDTQMGLLQGFAFNMFYSLLAIPFGYLADRTNRMRMIAVGIAAWSVMTMMTGLANSYGELLVARMGVGIGEATLTPAVVSLVADYFMPTQRGKALGTFTMANFLGSGFAGIIGGSILRHFAGQDQVIFPVVGGVAVWQSLFLFVGFPGLFLAVLVLMAREPQRQLASISKTAEGDVSWGVFFRHVAQYKWAFICTLGTSSMVTYTAYTCIPWVPTYLTRNFGFAPGMAAIVPGMTSLFAGVIGCVITGFIGDLFTKKDHRGGRLRVSAFCWPLVIPGLLLFTTSHNVMLAMLGWGMFQLANGLSFGSAYAIIQEIVPPRLKGRVTALWYLVNALATSMGTLVTALGTDYLFKDPEAIPQAIQIMAGPAVVLGICFMWFGLKPFDRARHAVQAMR